MKNLSSLASIVFFFGNLVLHVPCQAIEQGTSLRHSNRRNTNSKVLSLPKILIYITTHMSNSHKEFLKYCWPQALKNSRLLNSSDISVHMTPEPEDVTESVQIIKNTFKNQNLSYHVVNNFGYNKGAIAAITDASKSGWFDGYDWVFRMNPDVIIQNDKWFLDTIQKDVDASLLYVECFRNLDHVKALHTDFFAVKLTSLPPGHLNEKNHWNAEYQFTERMQPLIEKRQHRHIPGAYPKRIHTCRIDGDPDGPVFHFHYLKRKETLDLGSGHCPARFSN